MTAAEKKAFLARMAAGRKRAAAKKRKPAARKAPAKKATKKRAAPAGRKKTAPKKGKRNTRRNPDEMSEAQRMYEDFHGRPANRTIEHHESHEYRSELAELGKLLELRFKLEGESAPMPLIEFGSTQVTCTPDGTNIYLLGGNQTVDLEAINIETDKDYVELGECTYIRYHTCKGFHDFEPTAYWHKFGEVNGVRPMLAYDAVNKKLFLLGGDYECRPEGIVN
jgi:hypothetical protein